MATTVRENDQAHLSVAIEQAKRGLSEAGIPIGSVLVMDDHVVGEGRNRRVQYGDPILHAEMDALRNAGRRTAAEYRRMTMYTTLSPCHMCTGAVLLFGIPRVVIADSETFRGPEWLLLQNGVSMLVLDSSESKLLMREFIEKNPSLWNEDIGE